MLMAETLSGYVISRYPKYYIMSPFIIEGTDDSPKITLDHLNAIFEISGRSLPEDSATFYLPVLQWINEYAKQPNPSTEFVFKMEYFNTASSKYIHDLLLALRSVEGIRILWSCREDDEATQEAGIEFSEQIDIPFFFTHHV